MLRTAWSLGLLLLAGCGRVIVVDCEDVPAPDPSVASWAVTCAGDSPILCRDIETDERCIPAAAQCWADGEARCEAEAGVVAPSLQVVCLTGDYDRNILERTRPCTEVLLGPPPDEDDGTGGP